MGLFFYGMKIMSEGIMKMAGSRFRNMMANVTQTPFRGLLTGAIITGLIQSSSAMTVMVVSFVHARLLNLRQAMAMIMGSNLGTTITAWIVAVIGANYLFDFRDFSVIMVGIGTLLFLIKHPTSRKLALFFIGFGILFIGLSLIRDYVLSENIDIERFIRTFQRQDHLSIILLFLLGFLLTVAVQSSSVAVTITMMLAINGKIDLLAATAIILGENVGTTTTALIASLGCNRNAKRAALLHTMFNVFGVLWMLPLLPIFVSFIESINFVYFPSPEVVGNSINPNAGLQIAFFHTTFNLINICILFAFIPWIVRLIEFIVPKSAQEKSEETETPALVYAGGNALFTTGEINIYQAESQLKRLLENAAKMFGDFIAVYKNPEQHIPTLLMEIEKLENKSDSLSKDLIAYLINCSANAVSTETEIRIAKLINATTEVEEVCDCITRLVTLAEKRFRKKRMLSESISEEFLRNTRPLRDYFDFVTELTVRTMEVSDMNEAAEQREFFKRIIKQQIKNASMRLHHEVKTTDAELLHIQILNECNNISRHLRSIAKGLYQK